MSSVLKTLGIASTVQKVATVLSRCPDSTDAALKEALKEALVKFGLNPEDYTGILIYRELFMNFGDCFARARRKFNL